MFKKRVRFPPPTKIKPALRGGFIVVRYESLSRRQALSNRRQYLLGFGETARGGFREQDDAVRRYVEDAAATLHQLGLHAQLFLDRGRQAGGPGFIPSPASIRYPQFHTVSLNGGP